eukprot:COSAG01_NODE_6265_length_3764_cov_1.787995_2_plen_45_part_00
MICAGPELPEEEGMLDFTIHLHCSLRKETDPSLVVVKRYAPQAS